MARLEAQVAAWARDRIAGLTEYTISEIVEDAIVEHSDEFKRALAEEQIRSVVHRIVQKEVAQTRPNRPRLVRHGDFVTDLVQLRRRLEAADKTWGDWMEFTGSGHVAVLDMRKADLIAAATIRQERGDHELHLAGLWRTLAAQLDDMQRVRDVMTGEEVEKIAAGLRSAIEVRIEDWDEVVRAAAENSRRAFS